MVSLDYVVSASGDDGGVDETGAFSNSGSIHYIGWWDGAACNLYVRFLAVTIPVGAIITVAYLSFREGSVDGNGGSATIYGDDSASPTAPTSAATYNAKVLTSASVPWSPGTSAGWKNTPSLVSIVQEIVDSYNLSAGAPVQFLVKGGGSGQNDASMRAFDYFSTPINQYAPKLHIEYSVAVPGSSLVVPIHRRRFNAIIVR